MADDLRARFGERLRIELVEGGRGIFDVRAHDKLVFSKHQARRFPQPGEVEALVQAQLEQVG